MKIKTFGNYEQRAYDQLRRCGEAGDADYAVLCADNHVGYSQPIGGAIAYENYISPSGVGYDIASGNKAARTDIRAEHVDISKVMDEIVRVISFGVGRANNERVDDPVLDEIAQANFKPQRKLAQQAAAQLRGSGADEAPEVYKSLSEVLDAHVGTIKVLHHLKPLGVAMAGEEVFDPYKD